MNKKFYSIFIISIFILAASLRLATIWCGTNVDEGVYWVEGRHLYDGYVMYRDYELNKPPLVNLVAASFFIFGDTPIYPMRLCMVAFSLLGMYWLYALSKMLFGRTAALATLLLIAMEPYSCVWAKSLHTSTWAPFFEAGILLYFLRGLREQSRKNILISGILLGLYALNKQSAIFMLPVGFVAWVLFVKTKNVKSFGIDWGLWALGGLFIWAPFLLYIGVMGIFSYMWFDIWTTHYLLAPWFKDHTFTFRIHEIKAVMSTAPVLWLLPIGSLTLCLSRRRPAFMLVWFWLIITFYGNVFSLSHLWKHYLLVGVFPAAILGGAFWSWLTFTISQSIPKEATTNYPIERTAFSLLVIVFAMLIGWKNNDWTYPGLSLFEEKKLSQYIIRACPEPYMLNLTNPAFYNWTGKKVPPSIQGTHTTRLPYFMTFAGRGYMTKEDMQKTVELWEKTPIGCVIAYDKYLSQISTDPVLEPMKIWLVNNYKEPRRVNVGQSYYGWFWLFEKKNGK